jgi:hypothetical protein
MPDRKKGDHKPASPDGEVIAKAERRLAEADKQRARIKADPEREVARERLRVKRAKKKPGPRGEKRPADVIGNAVKVMRIATGEIATL